MAIYMAVIQLALVAIAFALCGYLFFTLKRDLFALDRKRLRDAESSRAEVARMRHEIAGLQRELESTQVHAQPAAGANSINLHKRSQALKLIRTGSGPEHIAAALNMPRNEVDLLIKVQRMLLPAEHAQLTAEPLHLNGTAAHDVRARA